MELARRMVDHFQAEKLSHVYLVPTHMVLDPIDAYYPHPYMVDAFDFKIGNAVHPAPLGDRQRPSLGVAARPEATSRA